MKTNMKNLLHEIKANKSKREQELFNRLEADIRSACQKFYEDTGCTVAHIEFPIKTLYVLGKSDPNAFVVMMPEIEVSELNFK